MAELTLEIARKILDVALDRFLCEK